MLPRKKRYASTLPNLSASLDILAVAGRIIAMAPEHRTLPRLPCPVEVLRCRGPARPARASSIPMCISSAAAGRAATRRGRPSSSLSGLRPRRGEQLSSAPSGRTASRGAWRVSSPKPTALRSPGHLDLALYRELSRIPPTTVTGDIMKDIMMIEPIIGAGELASIGPSILPSDPCGTGPHRLRGEGGRACSPGRRGSSTSISATRRPALGPARGARGCRRRIPRTQFMPYPLQPQSAGIRAVPALGRPPADGSTSRPAPCPSFIEEGEIDRRAEALRRFRRRRAS